MENELNQFKKNKEVKRHKSAIIPPGPLALNNNLFGDNSDNESNNTNLTTCEGLFKLKSNSLFAYQEFDKYSSFCDNDSNIDNKISFKDNYQKDINFNKEEINGMDDFNNTSSTYSMINEDFHSNNTTRKRKSAFDFMPPYFAQYLSCNYPTGEEMIYFDKNNNNFLNNLMNNQFTSVRRTHTEKQNKNFINAFLSQLNNIKNNQEQISKFDNKGNSQDFLPIYNYNAYNPNYNTLNNFSNIFYLNNTHNGEGSSKVLIQEGNPNYLNNNINPINSIENRDFPETINEFPENFRKKSNSLALKSNTLFNQGKNNKANNNNLFTFTSKINSRNNKFLNNNNNNVFNIIQDQSKCRNIQEQLELHKNDFNYIHNFFEQIKPELINIIEHQFGNYIIQKFLEILIYQENKQLINEFITVINNNDKLYDISINNYGTRVVQRTLEILIVSNYSKIETSELNNSINKLIESHLYDLCRDKNGNHVFQKLLKVFHDDNGNKNDFLFNYFSIISLDIALLQQGATIFSTALDLSNYKQKEKICSKIIENIERLINDKYGNYSLQAIINKLNNEKNLIEPIYLYISNHISELSKQKCSSNVIDTFIMKNDNYSKMLVNDIIKKDIIKDIIKDQYGNYVIQKAMHISDKETISKIAKQIKPIIPELLESNIGRKIHEKLVQQYNDVFKDE